MESNDKNTIKCRTCDGNHWTYMCPLDTLHARNMPARTAVTSGGKSRKVVDSEHVPLNMRDGTTKSNDDNSAICITNLNVSITESDLKDLVKPFGPLQRLYLAKDKETGLGKGFAFIHFKFRNDAAKAMSTLNGYGYDHLILNVDWFRPPSSSNQ